MLGIKTLLDKFKSQLATAEERSSELEDSYQHLYKRKYKERSRVKKTQTGGLRAVGQY